jgi:hypothetical protein
VYGIFAKYLYAESDALGIVMVGGKERGTVFYIGKLDGEDLFLGAGHLTGRKRKVKIKVRSGENITTLEGLVVRTTNRAINTERSGRLSDPRILDDITLIRITGGDRAALGHIKPVDINKRADLKRNKWLPSYVLRLNFSGGRARRIDKTVTKGLAGTKILEDDRKEIYRLTPALEHGNSGSPAFTDDGRFLGIAFARSEDSALGLTWVIPAKRVNDFVEKAMGKHKIPSTGKSTSDNLLPVAVPTPVDTKPEVPVKEGSLDIPLDIGFTDTVMPLLKDIGDPEDVAVNIVGAIKGLSVRHRVTLIFDADIGKRQNLKKMSEVIRLIARLKKDEPLLRHLDVIMVKPEDICARAEEETGNGSHVFVFSLLNNSQGTEEVDRNLKKREFAEMEKISVVSYIDETGFPEEAYYPLAEIVAIALVSRSDAASLERAREDSGVVNILSINEDGPALIFTLFPDAELMDIQSLAKRYGNIIRALKNA